MKLVSLVTQKYSEVESSKKSVPLFIFLLVIGIAFAYAGIVMGGLFGFLVLLLGVACVMAGIMQLVGVAECVCPDCGTKGYIYKYAKQYKCKNCNVKSAVTKDVG